MKLFHIFKVQAQTAFLFCGLLILSHAQFEGLIHVDVDVAGDGGLHQRAQERFRQFKASAVADIQSHRRPPEEIFKDIAVLAFSQAAKLRFLQPFLHVSQNILIGDEIDKMCPGIQGKFTEFRWSHGRFVGEEVVEILVIEAESLHIHLKMVDSHGGK